MGKIKGKKKSSKAGANFNSAQTSKPYNPFEEKITKEKHEILGRSLKTAKGKPGASRSQACIKRKHTLLVEYEQQHKNNSISDRRIGEKNQSISQEDKTVARYAAVRSKQKNKQLYNLESNEILTHNGITLNEIEKFEDPRSEDEYSDDNSNNAINGKLDKQFVSEAHFGGGVLSRKSNNANCDGPKSYKDIINQLIVESKKRKDEKQRQKECTHELTNKLDSEWNDLLPLMTKHNKSLQHESVLETGTSHQYDTYVSELRFEARGIPSDKLKTDTEISAEEAATRETLERERHARMQGPCFSNPTPTHRSVDDLDDNCLTSFNHFEDLLRYNESGVLINRHDCSTDLETKDIDNSAHENDKHHMNLVEESEESSDAGDEQDRFSDLQSDSESDDNNIDDMEIDSYKSTPTIGPLEASIEPVTNKSFPKSYEHFKHIFDRLSRTQCNLQLSQLIQYSKSTPNRKNNINFILTSILRYIRDSDFEDPLSKCVQLLPTTYDLVQIDPETSCNTFIEILQEIKTEYKASKSITMGMLLWFKIVVSVFSVSDFRHAVATAALMVLEDMLDKTAVRVRSRRDVVGGLFLATLMIEFTWVSRRFSPALIKFLTSIINCGTKSNSKANKKIKMSSNILLLTTDNTANSTFPLQLNLSLLTSQSNKDNTIKSDDFKITAIYVALKLLQTAYSQLKVGEMPSRCEAFTAAMEVAVRFNVDRRNRYPKTLTLELDALIRMTQEDVAARKLQSLSAEKKRPKPMKLYEPNIQTIYDHKQHGPKCDRTERDKLLYKLKQERKGALREIRKDVTFLGSHRIRNQIKSDMERKAQVKKIFAEAAIQQCDLNSLKRMNKRR